LLELSKRNWTDVVDRMQNIDGWENAGELEILMHVNLCPIPIVSRDSFTLFRNYKLLDGIGNVNLFELQKYPAVYVQAVEVIDTAKSEGEKRYAKKD